MRHIVLLCSAGVSTNILVKKMEEEAARLGYECTITAYSLAQAAEAVKVEVIEEDIAQHDVDADASAEKRDSQA